VLLWNTTWVVTPYLEDCWPGRTLIKFLGLDRASIKKKGERNTFNLEPHSLFMSVVRALTCGLLSQALRKKTRYAASRF
jgi:hypothetical protein